MRVLYRLRRQGRVECLNPEARRSRVYARTGTRREGVDWELYGWVSYSHRRAVLLALDEPRQPAGIKRRARFLQPGIRMSANNVRDVIRLFHARGIVRPVHVRKRAHPRYELTRLGEQLQRLVLEGETR